MWEIENCDSLLCYILCNSVILTFSTEWSEDCTNVCKSRRARSDHSKTADSRSCCGQEEQGMVPQVVSHNDSSAFHLSTMTINSLPSNATIWHHSLFICDQIGEKGPNPTKHTFAVCLFHVNLGRLSYFFTNALYNVLPNLWPSFTARQRSRTELRLIEAGRSGYVWLAFVSYIYQSRCQ